MSPGWILSARPVTPDSWVLGMTQNGPGMRGNSTNSRAARGRAWAMRRAESATLDATGRRYSRRTVWASAAVMPSVPPASQASDQMACSRRNMAKSRK